LGPAANRLEVHLVTDRDNKIVLLLHVFNALREGIDGTFIMERNLQV
jgi:hypothetical protein